MLVLYIPSRMLLRRNGVLRDGAARSHGASYLRKDEGAWRTYCTTAARGGGTKQEGKKSPGHAFCDCIRRRVRSGFTIALLLMRSIRAFAQAMPSRRKSDIKGFIRLHVVHGDLANW
ncbi:MAG: hypothetical protein ACREYF_19610 [Gammaproteobacteria bacterium]